MTIRGYDDLVLFRYTFQDNFLSDFQDFVKARAEPPICVERIFGLRLPRFGLFSVGGSRKPWQMAMNSASL